MIRQFGRSEANRSKELDEKFPQIPAVSENNVWYSYDEHASHVIIFVHGIFSDSRTCWLHQDDNVTKCEYWPELVRRDLRLCNPAIFLGGFYTDPNSTTYEIRDCAHELFSALRRPSVDGRLSPLDFHHLIFVTHSTGGIVVRYLLERHKKEFTDKEVGLVLVASPSYGSKWANRTDPLSRALNNRLSQQLKWGNDSLQEIDDRFRELVDGKHIPNLKGTEAYENHFLRRNFFWARTKVVDKESAGRYFGSPRQLPNTDHSTCVKPDTFTHPAHELLVDFYTSLGWICPASSWDSIPAPKGGISRHAENNIDAVLFDVYQPGYETYYVKRSIDDEFARAKDIFHLWVFGPSGCGKTCLIRRNLVRLDSEYIFISLANYYDSSAEEWLAAVIEELFAEANRASPPERSLPYLMDNAAKLLCTEYEKRRVYIHIEEIPVRSAELLTQFAKLVSAFLVHYATKAQNENVKFVFSSIDFPYSDLDNFHNKVHERLRVMPMTIWSEDAIKRLVIMISEELKLALSEIQQKTIKDFAQGSPRFVKKLFRNLLARQFPIEEQFDTILRETEQELG
nr:hypothetical protein [Thiohalomonas denitrificans]